MKQKIVGLNFPEKLIYENGRVQAPKMNEVISYYAGRQSVKAEKKGQRKKFFHFVPGGEPAGIAHSRLHAAPPLVIPMIASAFKQKIL